ncbi:MAG: class I SAM-dependent methyltransferase [candidate division KSB1 bacterium]|nr:class I SAM-dependent methyltransferase [candidate division KSB1 bacterium]
MNKWDERYSREDYVYGREPNEFLVQVQPHIPMGRVLCLGEGEGRNAVFLAGRGYEVTAVDLSPVGLAKAERLAAESGVKIRTIVADLSDFFIEPRAWQGIVSIFCHLEPALRRRVHRACAEGLAEGGALVLEAFTPEQLRYGTGGPKSLELLYSLKDLYEDFPELNFLIGQEKVCRRVEGLGHTGDAAVVQVLALQNGPLRVR